VTTSEQPETVFRVETDQQLHAVGSLARHRVLRVLRDGPATVTQIADRLGIAKGSSHYHVRVLDKAGLIRVVETRKVRGVEERYYAMAATAIALPESGPGEPDQRTVRLKHARLSPAAFGAFEARLHALIDELTELSDPQESAADLFVAFYRPRDTMHNGEASK
jgi:DNA-binding transcriptional ArsR family regulator